MVLSCAAYGCSNRWSKENPEIRFHRKKTNEYELSDKERLALSATTSTLEGNAITTPSVFRTRLPQVLANVTANLLMLDLCMSVGFTTIIIGATLGAKEGLSINDFQASWLGSIAYICQPVGSVMSGLIIEFFGRKWAMILVNIPFLIGWLLYNNSYNVTMLFIANVILGVGIGFMEAPIMTYTSETCQPDMRNILTSIPGITTQASFFVVFLMDTVTDWRTAAGINVALPIITALYVMQMPETPIWLLSRGRHKDAEQALCWLRGWVTVDIVTDEFNQLLAYNNARNKTRCMIETSTDTKTEDSYNGSYDNRTFQDDGATCKEKEKDQTEELNPTSVTPEQNEETVQSQSQSRWKQLVQPPTLRPLRLVIPFFFLVQLGGMASVRPFMIHVFHGFGLQSAASWSAVGSAGICVIGSLCLVLTVHWLGKRFISLLSMLGSAASCLLIGVYSYIILRPGGATQYATPWIPFMLFIILSFFHSFMFQIPFMLLSEVFPFRTRGIASGLSAAMCYVFLFTASMTYLYLEQQLQLYGTFWLFTFINCVGFIFLYWKMPETEGKSLAEIEQYFTDQT